jgi:hypothetical protein
LCRVLLCLCVPCVGSLCVLCVPRVGSFCACAACLCDGDIVFIPTPPLPCARECCAMLVPAYGSGVLTPRCASLQVLTPHCPCVWRAHTTLPMCLACSHRTAHVSGVLTPRCASVQVLEHGQLRELGVPVHDFYAGLPPGAGMVEVVSVAHGMLETPLTQTVRVCLDQAACVLGGACVSCVCPVCVLCVSCVCPVCVLCVFRARVHPCWAFLGKGRASRVGLCWNRSWGTNPLAWLSSAPVQRHSTNSQFWAGRSPPPSL